TSTEAPRTAVSISAFVVFPLSGLRHTIVSSAPLRASSIAVAWPMPEVAPVMTTRRPVIRSMPRAFPDLCPTARPGYRPRMRIEDLQTPALVVFDPHPRTVARPCRRTQVWEGSRHGPDHRAPGRHHRCHLWHRPRHGDGARPEGR